MSEINNADVFEREIKVCGDFRHHEETEDIRITFNVSSTEMNIWVNYYNNWNAEREIEILNTLIRRRILDQSATKFLGKCQNILRQNGRID